MTRLEKIENAAEEEKGSAYRWHSTYDGNKSLYDYSYGVEIGFMRGAGWADANPMEPILELIHQRSIAFDHAKEASAKLVIAVEALKKMDIVVNALKEIAKCEVIIDGDCPSIAKNALERIK